MAKLIVHEYAQSGNCYKIRLTAALLGLRMERVEYDIMKGETRTPQFRAHINPLGRIPVLQVGQRFLPESNAACFYLADGSSLIPEDRFEEYKSRLEEHGVRTGFILNHDDSPYGVAAKMHPGVFIRSLYFVDPDGIVLEFAAWTREIGPDEATHAPRTAADRLVPAEG